MFLLVERSRVESRVVAEKTEDFLRESPSHEDSHRVRKKLNLHRTARKKGQNETRGRRRERERIATDLVGRQGEGGLTDREELIDESSESTPTEERRNKG